MNSPLTANDSATARAPSGLAWVNPLEVKDWDLWLQAHSNASLFHSTAWAKVLFRSYGFQPCYLARLGPRSIEAFFPVVGVKSWLTGNRGVALPFTDECPPLGQDQAELAAAFNQVRDFGIGQKWKYLEIRGAEGFLGNAKPSVQFFRHVLDLRPAAGALWDKLDSSVRRAVRKAQQAGVKVEITNRPAAMDQFYELNCVTRKKHGLPPQPYGFFKAIQDEVMTPGNGWIAEASHQGQVVASCVFFIFGKGAIYKYGASNPAGMEVRANNLVMWEAIARLNAEGFHHLHFGRSSRDNEGLCRYKRQFGAAETLLSYYKYDYRQKDFVTDADKAFGWHNQVFSRLPMPLSRLIGRLAYRHVA
jgi:hypothetical protein